MDQFATGGTAAVKSSMISLPCQSAGSQTESVSEVRYRWHCREDRDHCRWPEREGSVVSSKDVRSWAMAQAEGYLRR
jgi:hypothetical protein